jgi:hypothetical protein
MVVYACDPSYSGGIGGSQAQDSIWKITKISKDWGHDSSSRALAYQIQGPEFKTKYH